jgi:DNA-binding transcriptional MerR regulator
MRSAPVSVAARLRRQRMPLREIRAVLTADDPRIVRRHLELHRERLEERLAEQRALLDSLERTLSRGDRGTAGEPCRLVAPTREWDRRTREGPGP